VSPPLLLVEDDEDSRTLYRLALEYFGYDVMEAADGADGLAAARVRLPGLVILDLSLPRMDGWSTLRELRADPATARVPAMALTGHATESVRARAVAAGFDLFLPKPVPPSEVLDHVRRLVGPPDR
jgi:two-component system, cell cycle response regulator DivK